MKVRSAKCIYGAELGCDKLECDAFTEELDVICKDMRYY